MHLSKEEVLNGYLPRNKQKDDSRDAICQDMRMNDSISLTGAAAKMGSQRATKRRTMYSVRMIGVTQPIVTINGFRKLNFLTIILTNGILLFLSTACHGYLLSTASDHSIDCNCDRKINYYS